MDVLDNIKRVKRNQQRIINWRVLFLLLYEVEGHQKRSKRCLWGFFSCMCQVSSLTFCSLGDSEIIRVCVHTCMCATQTDVSYMWDFPIPNQSCPPKVKSSAGLGCLGSHQTVQQQLNDRNIWMTPGVDVILAVIAGLGCPYPHKFDNHRFKKS